MSLTPLLAGGGVAPPQIATVAQLGLLAGAEVVTGLALGGLVRLFSVALDVAATAIAATASLSQLIGVANEYSPHPIGNLMHLAGLALIMALGFPVLVCDLLRESFVLRPLGAWPDIAALLPTAIDLTQRGFVLAMLLVVFIGAPGAILLAMLGLAVLTPSILSIWADAVADLMQTDLP